MEELFSEGMEASHTELQPDDCPYSVGSLEQVEWLKGYVAAEEDRLAAAEIEEEIGFGPR